MRVLHIGLVASLLPLTAAADEIQGSLCVGLACAVNQTFLGETLLLKETIIRIRFDDTSNTLDFPSNDWLIGVNGSQSGDDSFFLLQDVTSNTFPFRVDAGASTDALRVNASGSVGLGTGAPNQNLHIQSGNSPTIRLEQDGSGALPGEIWDVGGNEANFFVRTIEPEEEGTLPFRIRPGAPDNALYVAGNGEIGMGIPDPQGALHIRRNQPNNVPHLLLQSRRTDGRVEIWMQDDTTPADNDTLRLQLNGDVFNVSFNGTGGPELAVTKTGDVRIPRGDLVVPTGGVIVGGQTLNVPDYVFAEAYELMPLADLRAFVQQNSHLPHVPSAARIQAEGLDITEMLLALLKSHEELVLHTFALHARLAELEADAAPRPRRIAD